MPPDPDVVQVLVVAIIGDTGKSSGLEAMTHALYGRTSFAGHGSQEIVNDQSEHCRVELPVLGAGATNGCRHARCSGSGAARSGAERRSW